MSKTLTTTSYAVLAQVAVRPWATYELVQQRVRYFRYVWPRAESAIYREVKRLASMGLIRGHKEFNGKRPRTIYSITNRGKKALREWLATPISPFTMDFEALLRLFIAPFGTKEQLTSTLEQVRTDARAMLEFAGEAKREYLDGVNVAQDQVYIRALGFDFFVSLLHTVDAWVTRTLEEIAPWDDLSPTGKNERGLRIIEQLPVEPPRAPIEAPAVAPHRNR